MKIAGEAAREIANRVSKIGDFIISPDPRTTIRRVNDVLERAGLRCGERIGGAEFLGFSSNGLVIGVYVGNLDFFFRIGKIYSLRGGEIPRARIVISKEPELMSIFKGRKRIYP